jgi:glutamyl-tRNA synthetase
VKPRVRFAPSPTGFLHVGGARTALYNWLFARSLGGTFILRSDDTDLERSSLEYADDILDSLGWLGLSWDEGIEVGGPHGSYRQSDRFARYQEVAEDLVAAGAAYRSFATPEQLERLKDEARAATASPAYDGRYEPDVAEAAARVAAGEPSAIRFRIPRPGHTVFGDVVRGEIGFDHAQVDDFVILRSDGSPTYHLASTVDDVDYAITHVIRGEDLLSSTPKHILLTEAMGGEPATYAHLSLLMGPDGKKLSKRHGHTAIAAYREDGYLPEAMLNYLALLGWSPGNDETVVPLSEMVNRFDLGEVSRNPAVFDPEKLQWMSGVYLRALSVEEFVARSLPLVIADLDRGLSADEVSVFHTIAPHVQARAKLLTDVPDQVRFLFVDEVNYDEESWEKVMTTEEAPIAIEETLAVLGDLESWNTEAIDEALRGMLAAHDLSARKGLQPIRVAISGSTVSPPLFESIEVLGRGRTVARLEEALSRLG